MSAKVPRSSFVGAVAWLALAAGAAAQGAPPPIPVELRARFGFLGPHVQKIGDGISGLTIADLDGDGRREVLVNDPRRARLQVLRHQGDTFASETISTDGQIACFQVGDVDGDGRPELLLVDGRGRLRVRAIGGSEREPIDLGLGGRGISMLVGDLDGDGGSDIVAASPEGLRWATGFTGKPRLSSIGPFEDKAYGLHLADVDGDRSLDLVLIVPGPAMNLRLRRGRGDGTFGPWLISNLEYLRYSWKAATVDGAPALATIDGPQRRVALYRFAPTGGSAALEWNAFGEASGKALPFAVGDFDGDGDLDIALAQPERARLLFLLWQGDMFVPRIVPTLAGTSSIAAGDVDRDGKLDLVLASPEEDALAWKSGALPLDAFPERLTVVDKPVTVAVDPDGGVLVIARTDKRQAHLDRARPGEPLVRIAELGRLPADPSRLLVGDIGDAEGLECAFIVPGEGLRIVGLAAAAPDAVGGAAKDRESKGRDAADRDQGGNDAAGFARKVEDGALSLCEHDGRPALMVVRDRFLRVFRSDAQGQLVVLTQDNGPDGVAEMSLAALPADGGRLYLDKKNNKLLRTREGAMVTSIDVPPFEFTHLIPHGTAALLLGPRGVLRVPFGDGPSLQRLAVHEPPTIRTSYWHGVAGDFDGDKITDLAVLDGHLPGVQILAGGADGLARALAMPVFEAPPSGEPNNEPRDIACGDVDGDGRDDLVLVAHDRVLIYLQEK